MIADVIAIIRKHPEIVGPVIIIIAVLMVDNMPRFKVKQPRHDVPAYALPMPILYRRVAITGLQKRIIALVIAKQVFAGSNLTPAPPDLFAASWACHRDDRRFCDVDTGFLEDFIDALPGPLVSVSNRDGGFKINSVGRDNGNYLSGCQLSGHNTSINKVKRW